MTDLTQRSDLRVNAKFRQTYAVWEITLKCNLACSHCGSRAGDARVNELSTSEALDLVSQMAELGIKEVTLIGGEAFMRPDWLLIAAEITKKGMKATMTTGGYGISLGTAKRMKAAGIASVSLSIDGLEQSHDLLRGREAHTNNVLKPSRICEKSEYPWPVIRKSIESLSPSYPCCMKYYEMQG